MRDISTRALIAEKLARRVPGWSLEQDFYTDPDIFQLDLDRVFRNGWLFAGHACQAAKPGQYFCYEVGSDSLIIIHGHDGQIRALFNVCRHRGSVICKEASGQVTRLVCPYHQWNYDTDGRLLRNTWMPDDFDKTKFSLGQAHIQNVAGLLFVSLAERRPDFPAQKDLELLLEPHGLNQAKLAYSETYDIETNWKLVIENQRECYHCPAKHTGYAEIQLDTDLDDPDKQELMEARREACRQKLSSLGLDTSLVNPSYTMSGPWWRVSRTPFRSGAVCETPDGQPAAPLMGDLTDPDIGNARANTYPNFWLHGSSDHMHTVRVTPIDVMRTRIQADWLVSAKAREGEDYDVEHLIEFSKRVNDEDHEITEDQAKGIVSSRYQPGPYSPVKETLVEHFVAWYLEQLSTQAPF